jgi:hypothetical protein
LLTEREKLILLKNGSRKRWLDVNFLKDYSMRVAINRNIGFLLLAIYLILTGLAALIPTMVLPAVLYGILAIAAGIFILIGR